MREEIKKIKDITYSMMNSYVSTSYYNSDGFWDDDFAVSKYRDIYKNLKKSLSEVMTLDLWNSLTKEDLDELMFGYFSSESDLRLIPIMYYDILPIGLKVKSLFGHTITVTDHYKDRKHENKNKDYIDNDIRCGCLAYGVYPVDIKK